MGAEGKMLTRAGWRNAGRCPICGEPGKDKGAQKAQEKTEFRREVDGHLATLDAEALLQAYDSHQQLLEDPPPSPEARWLLEESRRDDEAAMGAW